MTSLGKHFAAIVVAILALTALPAVGQAKEDKSAGLFVNLTTLETSKAAHAFMLANGASKRGHPVVIFLNHKAALVAAKDVPHPSFHGQSLDQLLHMAITNGAKVVVCRMCLENHGLTEPDLVDGAIISSPDIVHSYLLDPSYNVMTW